MGSYLKLPQPIGPCRFPNLLKSQIFRIFAGSYAFLREARGARDLKIGNKTTKYDIKRDQKSFP